MISSNDFRNGVTIVIDGQLWTVIEFLHVKPGKGSAFVRTRLKNVKTGATVERTFRAGEKLERAIVDNREMQMLYNDADGLPFHGHRDVRERHAAARPNRRRRPTFSKTVRR